MITDRRAAASDTLATGYILAQAIQTIGRYDIVFCGRQAIDGDTAQVGPQCAEKLGIGQITYLEELVALSNGTARIRRNVGNGWEIVETRLPALVTVVQTANNPRPPAAKRVLAVQAGPGRGRNWPARSSGSCPRRPTRPVKRRSRRRAEALKPAGLMMEQWGLDEIGADLGRCGVAGSPTKVFRIQAIVLTKEGFSEIPPTEEGIGRLIHELVVDRTLG